MYSINRPLANSELAGITLGCQANKTAFTPTLHLSTSFNRRIVATPPPPLEGWFANNPHLWTTCKITAVSKHITCHFLFNPRLHLYPSLIRGIVQKPPLLLDRIATSYIHQDYTCLLPLIRGIVQQPPPPRSNCHFLYTPRLHLSPSFNQRDSSTTPTT